MVVVALLAITAGAIMLRTAFAPIPDPRQVLSGNLTPQATGAGPNPTPGTVYRPDPGNAPVPKGAF